MQCSYIQGRRGRQTRPWLDRGEPCTCIAVRSKLPKIRQIYGTDIGQAYIQDKQNLTPICLRSDIQELCSCTNGTHYIEVLLLLAHSAHLHTILLYYPTPHYSPSSPSALPPLPNLPNTGGSRSGGRSRTRARANARQTDETGTLPLS